MNARYRHKRAYKRARELGSLVVFKSEQSTYVPETDDHTSVDIEVRGYATRMSGDPIVYKELALTELEAVTLFFVPKVFGELPDLDATVEWAGDRKMVRSLNPVAPSGSALGAIVVLV